MNKKPHMSLYETIAEAATLTMKGENMIYAFRLMFVVRRYLNHLYDAGLDEAEANLMLYHTLRESKSDSL